MTSGKGRHLSAVLFALCIGCGPDEPCIVNPCPIPLIATLTVVAPSAPQGLTGITILYDGSVATPALCSATTNTRCNIQGNLGPHRFEASAPGYRTAKIDVTVTGTEMGCNQCARADRQDITLTLVPE